MASEQQLRIDLAAALQLAARFHFHEGICNHFSVMTEDGKLLLNPHGVHWSRMRASDLLRVGLWSTDSDVEITALNIHSAIHKRHPAATCVMHTHMPYATALTCLVDPTLRPVHQNSLRFYDDVAYDYDYGGLAETIAEGDRIAAAIGDKCVLFMANHGITVVGTSIAQAFDRLYYLERACEVQVKAMSTGAPLREIGSNVARTTKMSHDTDGDYSARHFTALKALLPQGFSD